MYGLSEKAVKLWSIYLSDRVQKLKTVNIYNKWAEMYFGVPQGSTMGLQLSNMFINDVSHCNYLVHIV